MTRTALVVGAGIGGVRTAQALRAEGWQDQVTVVGAEPDPPYDRPPLSKQLLAGSWQPEQARLLQDGEAQRAGIELMLGTRAGGLAPAEHELLLRGGGRLAYDVLVVATGAVARPSPWRPSSGVHVLRTLADALSLRAALARPGPVVVVGGGFLGGEVASTATALGRDVTLVDPVPVPMGRLLGDGVGRLFLDLHTRHGVRLRCGRGVEAVHGSAGDLQVVLTDGERLPAACVVVAIGARPDDDWLVDSGLLVDDGVVCDAIGRALGARDVYAVGDVARWAPAHGGPARRAEHWTSAVQQAARVARAVVHPQDSSPDEPVPYVWTDQHDWRAQLLGAPADGTACAVLGDPGAPAGPFGVLYGNAAGALVGALLVGWPRAVGLSRKALAARLSLPAALARLRPALPPGAALDQDAGGPGHTV